MRSIKFLPVVCCVTLLAPAAARAQGAAASQAAPAVDSTRSLFDTLPNQFSFGGRLSSVDGDPARWQRYQDFRDGVLFTDARFTREDPKGLWFLHGSADNVGWRDQRYSGTYERRGRLVISGLWNQIPQFYSVDTKTPYTTTVSPLLLP